MLKSRFFSLALLAMLLLVCVGIASADSQVRIVRLSYLEGNSQIDRGQGLEKAIMNMPISQGMRLVTEADGHAEVEFEQGSTLRLAPNSQVTFTTLSLQDSGNRTSVVQVDNGTAYFDYKDSKHDDFQFAYGSQTVKLDHSAHFRLDVSPDKVELAVFNGEVTLPGAKELKVKKDETVAFDLQDPNHYDVAKGVPEENSDQWDSYRDKYEADYNTKSSSVGSPYSYGLTDLNMYGNWYNMPGYGLLWSPNGLGAGWDPFFDGYWAFYPGFGYTWLSSYPWGWMPYRYGNWVYLNNYSRWAWRPGNWTGWTPVPRVVGAPSGFRVPTPPETRSLGVVGSPAPLVPVGRGTDAFVSRGIRPGRTMTTPFPGNAAAANGSKPLPATARVTPMPAPVHPMGGPGVEGEAMRAPRMDAPRAPAAPHAAPAPHASGGASHPSNPH